ncbi:MAG: hypothetical protein JNL08_04485 [Planctomycetes bacterium]|nr:hypothetical protein [Planctomycetota bacterium]
MNDSDPDPIDRLDHDLARHADRVAPTTFDLPRLRRRARWLGAGPWLLLLALLAAIAAMAVTRQWWALAALLVFLPRRVAALGEHRAELTAMAAAPDAVLLGREWLGHKLWSYRFSVVVESLLGVGLGLAAWASASLPLAVVAAALTTIAMFRLLAVLPSLEAANRELGGDPPTRWMLFVLLVVVLLVAPFYLLARIVVRAGQWLRGERRARA